MKKLSKIILFLVIIFCVNNVVNAEFVCEKEEKKRLKALAEKVEFTYDYELVETKDAVGRNVKDPVFIITATNLNSDLKVTIMEDYFMDIYQEFKNGDSPTASLRGFVAGERVPITIYGFVSNPCSGIEVYKKYIKLPYYNSFSEDERCEQYPDFKYCSDLLSSTIKESVFESEFKRYVENLNKEPEIEKPVDKVNIVLILEIVGGVIIISTIVVILVIKRRKKYSL